MQTASGGTPHNENGVYAEHAEGVVHDVINRGKFFWFVGDEVVQSAIGIKVVEVDGGVDHEIVKRWQVAR